MHRLILRMGIILLLAATFGVPLKAQSPEYEKTLKGIQELTVVVEVFRSEIEAAGLHRADIQTDVELKLRLAGIKVQTREESLERPGAPWFYVNVNVILSSQGLAAFDISCLFQQGVFLIRDPSIVSHATTWDANYLGLVGKEKLQQIRDSVKDQVDQFINAYLSVNPKK